MTVDIVALIERVDLVDLIRRDTPLRKVGHEYHGPCPWCGGRDRFTVWPERRRWWCRGCAEHGDAIGYVRLRDGLGFVEACEALGASGSELGTPTGQGAKRPPALPPVELETPPGEIWRMAAASFLAHSQDLLWSDVGTRARAYLAARGLKEETVHVFGLGYQPTDTHMPVAAWGLDGHAIWAPRGIVIPHQVGDVLWLLNVRRPQSTGPKYHAIRGGTRLLFGVDTLIPGEVVALVEGEFDAMLLYQEGGGMPILATGGKRPTLGPRALQVLLGCGRVLVGYDAEPDADRDAATLVSLGPRFQRIRPPQGKDPTDYWKAGGDVGAWIRGALAREVSA